MESNHLTTSALHGKPHLESSRGWTQPNLVKCIPNMSRHLNFNGSIFSRWVDDCCLHFRLSVNGDEKEFACKWLENMQTSWNTIRWLFFLFLACYYTKMHNHAPAKGIFSSLTLIYVILTELTILLNDEQIIHTYL